MEEVGNAASIRVDTPNDADEVAQHLKPLYFKPFASINYSPKHISGDGGKHSEPHAGETIDRLESGSSECGSKSLGFSEREHATDVDLVIE